WAEPGDVFPGASVGAIGAHAAPTLARVDLGAVGQSRRPTPRRGGGQLLWAAVGLGVARLAGSGATAGPGVGCDLLGGTPGGAGHQRALPGLRHPGGLAGPARQPSRRLAPPLGTVVGPAGTQPARRVVCPGVGRPGPVRPLAVSPDRGLWLASMLAHQPRRQ